MDIGLYNAANAMNSLEKWQEITSQNISSGSVPGFKGQQMSFSGIHAGMIGIPGADKTLAIKPITMATPDSAPDFSSGMISQTGVPTHVAIMGDGFFKIQGEGYDYITRDGEFHVNTQNQIVNKAGHPVLGKTGPMTVSLQYGEITISRTGEIRQGVNSVGTLAIVEVDDPQKLQRVAGGFRPNPNDPVELKDIFEPHVLQGQLEGSNISPMREMVHLIEISRAFEVNQKVIQSLDGLKGKTIEVMGSTN